MTGEPNNDPELSSQLRDYGEYLRQYVIDDDDTGGTVIDLGAAPIGIAGSRASKKPRRSTALLAVAASVLVLVGLVSVANLAGKGDAPVQGETVPPASEAPAIADQTNDGPAADDGSDSSDSFGDSGDGDGDGDGDGASDITPTPTPPSAASPSPVPTATGANSGAATPEATPTPPPPTQTSAATPTPPPPTPTPPTPTSTPAAQPTSTPAPAATATPGPTSTPAPACAAGFELSQGQCLKYSSPITSAASCPTQAPQAADGTCRQAIAFVPLDSQCDGTVQGLTCVKPVASIQTQACPDGAVAEPPPFTSIACALVSSASQGPPTCPLGSLGQAQAQNGGCYIVVEGPDVNGDCPSPSAGITVNNVGGECRQPVANAAGAFTCPTGQQLSGTDCLLPVALIVSYECPGASTPTSTDNSSCALETTLTPQCPAGVSVAGDGTCYREIAKIPGSLDCLEGILQTDVCVTTGVPPQ